MHRRRHIIGQLSQGAFLEGSPRSFPVVSPHASPESRRKIAPHPQQPFIPAAPRSHMRISPVSNPHQEGFMQESYRTCSFSCIAARHLGNGPEISCNVESSGCGESYAAFVSESSGGWIRSEEEPFGFAKFKLDCRGQSTTASKPLPLRILSLLRGI
jgi:hypothetical protein